MMSVTLAILRILAEGGAFAALGALATLVGAAIVAKIEPLPDGPGAGRPADLVLIVLAGLVGVVAAVTGHDSAAQLFVAGVGAIYCDVARGIVPDFFTLLPLGLLVLLALAQGHPALLLAALLPAIPFAVAALFSRGRGMGWGDVKLAALGGAVLGLQVAVLAFFAACLTAVLVALWRRGFRQPVAFAPYLAGSIVVGLVLGGGR
jgi:prepilin signal peptidase PulO-like enzyme (type II secretory pathway)